MEVIDKDEVGKSYQGIEVTAHIDSASSIVGTRPPTADEMKLYDLNHYARLAIKPDITGMWQISDRSDNTVFEEVVRLDKEYIER